MKRPTTTSIGLEVALVTLSTLAPSSARAQDVKQPFGPPPVVATSESEHFRVACHFDTARLSAEAAAAAEPVWAATDKLLGGRTLSKERVEIHIYRGAADYASADQRITGGQFARNLAFTSEEPVASHIALQPEHDDSVFARAGLSAVSLRTVAHEAVHAVLYASMPNHDDHPGWLAEGLATYVAERALHDAGLAPRAAEDPMNSTRMVWTQALLAHDSLPTPRAIVETDLAELSFDNRYAVWWLFMRFLAETNGGDRLQSVIEAAWRIGGGSGYRERLATAVEQAWGAKALDALDAEFRTYVASLRPQWEEVSRTLRVVGTTWTQMAFGTTNTLTWRTEPVGRTKFRVKGSVEILYGTNPQMNLLLARSDVGFLMVAFRADAGVTLLRYSSADNTWANVGWMEAPEVQIGHELPFVIEVDGERITVRVAEQDALSWTLAGIDFSGPWGVGAQAGGAGIWSGVRIE